MNPNIFPHGTILFNQSANTPKNAPSTHGIRSSRSRSTQNTSKLITTPNRRPLRIGIALIDSSSHRNQASIGIKISVKVLLFWFIMAKIAYLDFDSHDIKKIQSTLLAHGYNCLPFEDGERLISKLKKNKFDLLLLNWDAPFVTGYDVLMWAKSNLSSHVPVIFLLHQNQENYVSKILAAGADDYIIQPFGETELIARINVQLSRSRQRRKSADQSIMIGDYLIDLANRLCYYRGAPILLTPKEFKVAALFFRHAGEILTREHLMAVIWGYGGSVVSRSLDTHVAKIRLKMKLRPENGVRLVSVYGHGYRMDVMGTQS
ncbi:MULTISPECIES: response regulator transcription factor [Burkholderia]|nr:MULTISPECIES: response regulator transcription factor [Burkholderia]